MFFTVMTPQYVIASEAATSPSSVIAERANPKETAKNKNVGRSHPDYKRCRREPLIGSLARMRTICMTNREWEEFYRAGNAGTRSLLEDINKGG